MSRDSALNSLLIDAPAGRHFAQFYRDQEQLTEAVSCYMESGLRSGSGVLIIASPENIQYYLARLKRSGLDPAIYQQTGQLVMLSARKLLTRFMRGGMPDRAKFHEAVGGVLQHFKAMGGNVTRAYGEMANMLWTAGRTQAAILLEEYWNSLFYRYSFSLFCTYQVDSYKPETYECPLHEIGRTHTDVIPTAGDKKFHKALDAASRDILSISISQLLSLSGREANPGESNLTGGQRIMLWIMRNIPESSYKILKRAHRYYQDLTL